MNLIDKTLKEMAAVSREESRLRRHQRLAEQEAGIIYDRLVEKINTRVPLKPRGECPLMSDADYKKYKFEQTVTRSAVLQVFLLKMAARTIDRLTESEMEDF